ncbi:MAG: glycosyltransferase family 2 protein [Vicinamibacterales bacterium]
MTSPLIVAVVLNTNRRDDTLACLDSLARLDYPNRAVMVLDNASTDGSNEAIRAAHPDVRILPLTDNRGYAGNNNVGIAAALEMGADWVLVLNEDTVLDPACFSELIRAAADPAVGVVGPMVYHHDEPTVIQSAGGRLDARWRAWHAGQNEDDSGQFPVPRDVEWISGCAILVRRQVIEQVGPLDERFFYYWEETEWCVRAARAGWRIVHAPAARIWHKGVTRHYRPGPGVAYYNTRNHLLLMSTHGAGPATWLRTWAGLARTLVAYTLRPRWRDRRAARNAIWWGAADFLRGRWGQMPKR